MPHIPLFSIVIPTRNRAHLLPFALNSAIDQQFFDYEIVVVANNCQDNTREVVNSFANERIRYVETDRTLTMPENWEFAWSQAKGEYVTFLSDDDAIVSSTLSFVAEKALHEFPDVISWEDAIYYYPTWEEEHLQNTLLLFYHGDKLLEDIPSQLYLDQLRRFDFAWSAPLPKLLNCFVNREFFENWRAKLGKLFFPIAPDYSFAWLSSQICSFFRVIHRPLSVRGISSNSIGSNAGLGSAGTTFYKEFGNFDFFEETKLNLPLTINHIAATFLRVNKAFIEYGIKPVKYDESSFIMAVAKQLHQCKKLLADWDQCFESLLTYVKRFEEKSLQPVLEIFDQPFPNGNPESLRDLHKRTHLMSTEYKKSLINAMKEHAGDEGCGACSLGFRSEVLVDQNWSYLYLFGERVSASDPYSISSYVDHYYNLMSNCRKKKLTNHLNSLSVSTQKDYK